MKINNPNNLPDALVRAATRTALNPDEKRISVTSLIAPPMIRFLTKQNEHLLTEDIEDKAWLLLGTGFHLLMEKYSQDKEAEVKLELPFNGFTLVGIPDVYDNKILYDYKVTSVYSFLLGEKIEWEQQLNCYAWMLKSRNIDINEIKIIAILRDWMQRKAAIEKNYPKKAIHQVGINKWPDDKVVDFINQRLIAHLTVTPCTPEERWRKPTTFAIVKKGVKKARRVLATYEEAEKWMKENNENYLSITERAGEDSRCKYFCPVANFCKDNIYQGEINDGE